MKKMLCLLLIFTAGCSAFVPWNQHIAINCSDPQATIIVDNQAVGTGHADVYLLRNVGHSVVATHDGRSIAVPMGNSVSITGALDIGGGVLFGFPVLGSLFPGFMDIYPYDIQIQLPVGGSSPTVVH